MSDNGTAAPTLRDLVTDYLENQDLEHLTRLRAAVVGSATFDPDLNLLAEVTQHMEAGRHREVVDAVTAKMPGAALNPTAHLALAAALEALEDPANRMENTVRVAEGGEVEVEQAHIGDEQAAKRENTMAKVAVSSVLMTGEGTEESPWSVLRVADEYDVMRAKGITPGGQSASTVDGRIVDRHETEDGPVWFVIDRPRT